MNRLNEAKLIPRGGLTFLLASLILKSETERGGGGSGQNRQRSILPTEAINVLEQLWQSRWLLLAALAALVILDACSHLLYLESGNRYLLPWKQQRRRK